MFSSHLFWVCPEPVRLVGGSCRCGGAVEVRYRGEWRRAITPDLWDLEAAAAVCQSLDCGSAVSTEQREGFSSRDVWEIRAGCVKRKAAVRDCIIRALPKQLFGLEVVCSGRL